MNTTPLPWQGPVHGRIRVGSEGHKTLFCRMLLDTFDPYKPQEIQWPQLSDIALQRLKGLPFWDTAVATEGNAHLRMQTMADQTTDPLLKEALELNAFEEQRHKDVIHALIEFYGIEIGPQPTYRRPPNVMRAYLRTGYGECFDSFFTFGLFKLANDTGFFPPALVEVFEPIMQEEARHILFFVNWVAYTRAQTPLWKRPAFTKMCLAAFAKKAKNRLKMAKPKKKANKNRKMVVEGHEALGIKITLSMLIYTCLEENRQRMARYDERLLRPQLVPRLVSTVRPLLRRS